VGAQTEVLMDGGVRSGVDIFKALALGARGVLVGRPWVWALAAQGQPGVAQLLAHWQRELQLTMTLTGVTRIADIGPQHLDTDL
jgi:L-lactate dehydrogenase (cytochrome)